MALRYTDFKIGAIKHTFPLSLKLPLNWTMNSNYTIKPNRNLWVIRVCLGQWVLMEEPANNQSDFHPPPSDKIIMKSLSITLRNCKCGVNSRQSHTERAEKPSPAWEDVSVLEKMGEVETKVLSQPFRSDIRVLSAVMLHKLHISTFTSLCMNKMFLVLLHK